MTATSEDAGISKDPEGIDYTTTKKKEKEEEKEKPGDIERPKTSYSILHLPTKKPS